MENFLALRKAGSIWSRRKSGATVTNHFVGAMGFCILIGESSEPLTRVSLGLSLRVVQLLHAGLALTQTDLAYQTHSRV